MTAQPLEERMVVGSVSIPAKKVIAEAFCWTTAAMGVAATTGFAGMRVLSQAGPVQFNYILLLLFGISSVLSSLVFLFAVWLRAEWAPSQDLLGVGVHAARSGALGYATAAIVACLYGLAFSFLRLQIIPEARSIYSNIPAEALAFLAFSFVIFAPLAEELFFRDWLWRALAQSWSPGLTAATTSGMWCFTHVATRVDTVLLVIPLAIMLAAARFWFGSVRVCIAMHAIANGTVLLIYNL